MRVAAPRRLAVLPSCLFCPQVRSIFLPTVNVTTFAGQNTQPTPGTPGPATANGAGSSAAFSKPYGITLAPGVPVVYVTDSLNFAVRQISYVAPPSLSSSASPSHSVSPSVTASRHVIPNSSSPASGLSVSQQLGLGLGIALSLALIILVVLICAYRKRWCPTKPPHPDTHAASHLQVFSRKTTLV